MRLDAGPSRLSSLRTIGSFSKRKKKKSSPYGPYLPGTFHRVEAVRRRTLSQASREGQRASSHDGRTRPETTRPPVIATLLPQKPRANFKNDLPRTFKALSKATIGSLRCSSHNSNRVLFLLEVSSSRAGS